MSIDFTYGPNGKPATECIDFNVSHSCGLAVFAFAMGCALGVDIERIRPMRDMQAIAKQFFCSEEAAELMSLGISQRDRGFYLCWTRKEAYVKAIGKGLSAPLDGFRVTVDPNQRARLVHLAGEASAAAGWTLHDLQLAPNYAAALAYHDRERVVVTRPVVDAAELLGIGDRPKR